MMPHQRHFRCRCFRACISFVLIAVALTGANAAARAQGPSLYSRLSVRVWVHLEHTPLRKALHALARAAGLTLIVQPNSTPNPPGKLTEPVTLNLRRSIRISHAIELVLLKAGEHAPGISWNVTRRALLVGSKYWVQKLVTVRVYKIAPLVEVRGPNGTYISLKRVHAIVRLIEGTVDRNSWIDNGGTVGSCSEIHGLLVVRALGRDQLQIGRLLREVESGIALNKRSKRER